MVAKSEIIANCLNNLENFAEFIGILLGDGSLSRYKSNNSQRMKITLDSREKEYSRHICNLIHMLFYIKPEVLYRKKENTADIVLYNRRIISILLDEFGMASSPKWNRAVIPDLCLNKRLDLAVLRGYFDTDGCVVLTNNNGIAYVRLEMKISPSPMQKQLIDILEKRGFRFGVYDIGRGKVRVQMNGKTQLNKWLKLVNFHNQRHIEKVSKYFKSKAHS
ncbi:hypothetical protein GF343_00455 [Candidatus Woesearchaeota archaeon]|nr:hypothetical protein [Candidatus Woesearchaeota archaeon]